MIAHWPLLGVLVFVAASGAVGAAAPPGTPAAAGPRTYPTAEAAAKSLVDTVRGGTLDEVIAIFGPEGKALVASSDEATGRRNREVFTAAAREGWRLVDEGPSTKRLVIGHEAWPFPVPIVKGGAGWQFDTAAGAEEIIARRIGHNELAAIQICRAYVLAQRRYFRQPHDGKPAGRYASQIRSDPGMQNGLYWPVARGQPRSPIGDLIADAADDPRRTATERKEPLPFHGYYFRMLNAQGAHAPGGARDYVVDGAMSRGFGLIAWPSAYDASGVMTFVVNQDGTVFEKDLGRDTGKLASEMTAFDPDASWRSVP
jgi:hypothetical protein